MISLDRNYREVINLLFVLPGLYLNILMIEKILQFWDKTWHVIPDQEVNLQLTEMKIFFASEIYLSLEIFFSPRSMKIPNHRKLREKYRAAFSESNKPSECFLCSRSGTLIFKR